MTQSSINVHIGEVKTAFGNDELHTILGSCIGIGFLWQKRGVYGLAHCLLSKSPNQDFEIGGRFVDQAIFSLTQLMSITDFRDIRAVVAGGGNMTRPDDSQPKKLVGYLNAQAALSMLDERNIIVVHQDTGGLEGRKLSIQCSTGEFSVRSIPRIAANRNA